MYPDFNALLEILTWNEPPEIRIEWRGTIGLDWHRPTWSHLSASIYPNGRVTWAVFGGEHGEGLKGLKKHVLDIKKK